MPLNWPTPKIIQTEPKITTLSCCHLSSSIIVTTVLCYRAARDFCNCRTAHIRFRCCKNFSRGLKYRRSMNIPQFSATKSLYVGNDADTVMILESHLLTYILGLPTLSWTMHCTQTWRCNWRKCHSSRSSIGNVFTPETLEVSVYPRDHWSLKTLRK